MNFPRFFPGIGILYVKPKTPPHGPFLAFDRKDTLVSTIYMVPLSEIQEHRRLGFDRMRQSSRNRDSNLGQRAVYLYANSLLAQAIP